MKTLAPVVLLTTVVFQCILAKAVTTPENHSDAVVRNSSEQSVTIAFGSRQVKKSVIVGPAGENLVAYSIPGVSTDVIQPGTPTLPIIEKLVRVPNRGRVTLTSIKGEKTLIGTGRVAPYQLPISHDGSRAPYAYNADVYACTMYPTEPVQLIAVERLGDIRVARLHYFPVQYNPQSGEIFATDQLEVTLSFTSERGQSEIVKEKPLRKSQLPFYKDVLNMGTVSTRASEAIPTYLFIGNSETLTQVASLINWKTQKGLQVITKEVSEIGSSSSQIDAFIESTYDEIEGNLFVLLCGDETIIPAFSMNCPYSQVKCPSDNAYGVVGSGYNPSVYVGRITHADQTMDAYGYQAWKIVEHESNPEEGAWMTKAMTWGCSQPNGEPTTSYWQKQLQAAGLSSSQELEAYGAKKAAQLVAAFDAGLTTFSMKGHGNDQSWHSAKLGIGYGNASVSSMDIGKRFCWINNIACLNSRFQYSQYTCFAEQMMATGSIGDAKGCLGMYSFTVSSSGGSPTTASDGMLSAVYDALFEEDIRHVGMAAAYGTKASGTTGDKKSSMLWGCPETDIYFQYPLDEFTAPTEDPLPGKAYSISTGIPGALVSLVTESYEPLASAYTDANGDVTLELPEYKAATILTMTARNTKPLILEYEETGILSAGENHLSNGNNIHSLQNRGSNVLLQLKGLRSGRNIIRLIDNRGRIIFKEELQTSTGETSIKKKGTLSTGIYMLQITDEKSSTVQKCTVQ